MILQKINSISLPTLLMGASTAIFFVMERVRSGRQLPQSKGWYGPRHPHHSRPIGHHAHYGKTMD